MILQICDNPTVLSVMRIVNIAILIIKIVVPILLILTGMITLLKTIKVGEEDLLVKAKKQLVNNCIAAVVVFFIPTFVSVLVKVSLTNGEYKDCLSNTSSDVINQKYYDIAVDSISKAESSSKYNDYYDAEGIIRGTIRHGITTNRPNTNYLPIGFQYFDITLNKPIWWNGTVWIDATGQEV